MNLVCEARNLGAYRRGRAAVMTVLCVAGVLEKETREERRVCGRIESGIEKTDGG